MQKKSKIAIAVAAMSIAGVAGITIGTTTALFSKSASANVHITSGSLDVSFYLESLTYDKVINGKVTDYNADLTSYDGYEANAGVNLKVYEGGFNVDRIYPSFKGTATFLVKNCEDMSVNLKLLHAFDMDKCLDKDGTKFTAEQLSVISFVTDNDPEEVVAPSAEKRINLSFTLSKDAGNEYMDAQFEFNVSLTATQALVRA